jgi:hypothetical protein
VVLRSKARVCNIILLLILGNMVEIQMKKNISVTERDRAGLLLLKCLLAPQGCESNTSQPNPLFQVYMATSDAVKNYILQQYQKRGNLDFYFTSRKLGRLLHISTSSVGCTLATLRETGMVQRYNRKIWITTINKKEPVKTPFWKIWLNSVIHRRVKNA